MGCPFVVFHMLKTYLPLKTVLEEFRKQEQKTQNECFQFIGRLYMKKAWEELAGIQGK